MEWFSASSVWVHLSTAFLLDSIKVLYLELEVVVLGLVEVHWPADTSRVDSAWTWILLLQLWKTRLPVIDSASVSSRPDWSGTLLNIDDSIAALNCHCVGHCESEAFGADLNSFQGWSSPFIFRLLFHFWHLGRQVADFQIVANPFWSLRRSRLAIVLPHLGKLCASWLVIPLYLNARVQCLHHGPACARRVRFDLGC